MGIYTGTGVTGGRRAGVVSATITGEAIDVVDCTYDPTIVKRETLTGQSGVQGFSEMPKSGVIEITVRDAGNLSVQAFNAMTDETLVLHLANGKTVSGEGMWTTEVAAVDTKDGSFKVTFEGPSVEES